MIVLALLSIVLTLLVGTLCLLMYRKHEDCLLQAELNHQMLINLDISFKELKVAQSNMHNRLGHLATDVLQREIYQGSDDRHKLAIQSAKQGRGLFELMQMHGLSSDEAALINSLHSPQASGGSPIVKNANLVDPAVADIV